MLRIERSVNGEIVYTLCGRIDPEDVLELQRLFQLEKPVDHLVLDLKDVTLVARDALGFLASCEADNVVLKNCPAYIREWIGKRKPSQSSRGRKSSGTIG